MGKDYGWRVVNRYFGISEGYSDYPKESGNYAIYVSRVDILGMPIKKKLMYIGTAQNLRARLGNHEIRKTLWGLMEDNWYNFVYVKCCLVKDEVLRKKRERSLIKRLQPRINCA